MAVADAALAAVDAPMVVPDAPVNPDAAPPDAGPTPPDAAPPPDACTPTVTADPSTLYALHQSRTVYTGHCFTPNMDVAIDQFSGWFTPCRGVIIVPGTTRPVGPSGDFSFKLPSTALAFTLYVGPVMLVFHDAGGASVPVTLDYIDGGASDVFVGPSTTGTPLTAVAADEHGSGTVKSASEAGPMSAGSSRNDFTYTIAGAKPNQPYTIFLDASDQCPKLGTSTSDAHVRSYGPATADSSGQVSGYFHAYLDGPKAVGYFTPTISFTSDGRPPGSANVAYQGTISVQPLDPSQF
jgi:hypothetical protein